MWSEICSLGCAAAHALLSVAWYLVFGTFWHAQQVHICSSSCVCGRESIHSPPQPTLLVGPLPGSAHQWPRRRRALSGRRTTCCRRAHSTLPFPCVTSRCVLRRAAAPRGTCKRAACIQSCARSGRSALLCTSERPDRLHRSGVLCGLIAGGTRVLWGHLRVSRGAVSQNLGGLLTLWPSGAVTGPALNANAARACQSLPSVLWGMGTKLHTSAGAALCAPSPFTHATMSSTQ